MKLLIFLGVHRKLDYFGGLFLNILGLFKIKIQNWIFFFLGGGGVLTFN